MTFPRRLLAACFVALATWLVLGAPSIAAVESPPSPGAVYSYDNQQHMAPTADAASERGPPAVYSGTITANDAVDIRSHGVSARPTAATTTPIVTYDHTAVHAQVAGGPGATRTASDGSAGDLRTDSGWRCAAKGRG